MSTHSYQIKLPQFEGPFDLLLFFIERDELDIYNIPIHQITKEFLDYIQNAEQLNIELASEFILFASTLMRIKSKMLIPRKEVDILGNEIDPRAELVDKIIEYKRFKDAAATLAMMEAERLLQERRGNAEQELIELGKGYAEGSEIQHITLFKLMNTFEKVMKKFKERMNKPQHVVMKYNYSQEGQREYLISTISGRKKVQFEDIFLKSENRIHAIFIFLALLELIQLNFLNIITGSGRNNFFVSWNESKEI